MNLNTEDIKIIFKKNLKKNIKITSFVINSKEVRKGSIFFAVKGKNTDGHFYINEVLKNKAEIIVVRNNFPIPKNNKDRFIKVTSPIKFLSRAANYIRKMNNNIFIGITGSYGKTTLKSMLHFFLSKYNITYSSPKSFNNHFGLPLSLSNTPSKSKFNIFELGMSSKGEINNLSKILIPNIGVITNIGPAHLKNFRNLHDICLAKAEIMNHLKNGVIFLNRDDFYYKILSQIAKTKKLKIISFGSLFNSNIKIIKKIIKNNNHILRISVFNKIYNFEIKNFNDNFVKNFLIVVGILYHLKLDIKKILKFSKKFLTPSGRGNLSFKIINKRKISIIDESYNANPVSMKNAINNFHLMKTQKEKIAIIGDMLELGSKSKFYHQQLAIYLKEKSFKKVYLIGKEVKYTYNKLKKIKDCLIYKNINDFKKEFFKILKPNAIYLFKSSNAIGLNKLLSEDLS